MSAHPAAGSRSVRRLRLPVLRRRSLGRLLIVCAAAALLVAGWVWLRDSALVRVDKVHISGASGERAHSVRAALEAAAQDMTTLDVDRGALRDAVARFTIIRDVVAEPDFPHTLRIRVIERVPVGAIVSDGSEVAVADDGVLLRDTPTSGLPTIVSRVPPSGARVAGRKMQVKVALLAAAPRRLRARVVRVTLGPQGLVAVLSSGPKLRFGDGGRLHAKWIAASRVLSDPAARTAAYIDLRVPERPAAGGLTVAEGGTQVEPPVLASAASAAPAGTTAPVQGATAPPAAQTPATQPGAAVQPQSPPQPQQQVAPVQQQAPAVTGAAQAP